MEELRNHVTETTEAETIAVGELLQQKRQAADISIEEMAEITKISKTHLLAIEANRFEDLPGPAYLRGFIRLYAEQLGLDASQLLAQVNQQHKTDPEEIPGVKLEKPDKPALSRRIQRFSLPVLLLITLIASTLFFGPDTSETPTPGNTNYPSANVQTSKPELKTENEQAPENSTDTTETADTENTQADKALTDETVQTPEAETIKPEPVQVTQPKTGFMVKMKVQKNADITVTIDENIRQDYQVTVGDLIEWKAMNSIELDLSAANSVELELDGKPLKLQTATDKPLHLQLGPKGIIP